MQKGRTRIMNDTMNDAKDTTEIAEEMDTDIPAGTEKREFSRSEIRRMKHKVIK